MKLRLGTRGSDLARTQSGHVARALAELGIDTEFVIISTSGDRSQASSFGAIGPQGVFVREIEQALIAGEVDIAVHSCKDLPTRSPAGLVIAAIPARRDPADWLFRRREAKGAAAKGPEPLQSGAKGSEPFKSVPKWMTADSVKKGSDPLALEVGMRVGTASARRRAWLEHFCPGLVIESLRGNVPTRLRRVAAGDFDATLLAGAGIERLADAGVLDAELAELEHQRLDPNLFVPAPAQGALAVQCRGDDGEVRDALASIDDAATRTAITLERDALALAEGGCDTAFGAYARPSASGFALSVMLEREGRILRAENTRENVARLAADTMAALDAAERSAAR